MNGETREREGEKIGGGHFVFRRTEGGRITPNRCPYEHPTFEAAEKEARRLAAKYPGTTFIVVSQQGSAALDPEG